MDMPLKRTNADLGGQRIMDWYGNRLNAEGMEGQIRRVFCGFRFHGSDLLNSLCSSTPFAAHLIIIIIINSACKPLKSDYAND